MLARQGSQTSSEPNGTGAENSAQQGSPQNGAERSQVDLPWHQPAQGAAGRPAQAVQPSKVCALCGATRTPVWRTGANKEPLCNKCGLQAARKRRKSGTASLLELKSGGAGAKPGSSQRGKVPRQQGPTSRPGSEAGASTEPAPGAGGRPIVQTGATTNGLGTHGAYSPVVPHPQVSHSGAPPLAPAHAAAATPSLAIPSGFSSLTGVHLVVLPPPDPALSRREGPSPAPAPRPPAPRLVHNATLVLENCAGVSPLIHPTCLPVCLAAYDSWGQRLLASERFDVLPHLEYDAAYGCFVYDSGQDWWLLLPRAEQTEVFKALMHKFSMMKAMRMGLLPRPPMDLSLDEAHPAPSPSSHNNTHASDGGRPAADPARLEAPSALWGGPAAQQAQQAQQQQQQDPLLSRLGGLAGVGQQAAHPHRMPALSGLLTGPGGAPGHEDQPQQARQAGGGGGRQGQLEEEDAMCVLESLTALGPAGLGPPRAPGGAATGGRDSGGGAPAAGGGLQHQGSNGRAGAGGVGLPGSLDFASMWDAPSANALDSRTLSGLTHVLLGIGSAEAGLGAGGAEGAAADRGG